MLAVTLGLVLSSRPLVSTGRAEGATASVCVARRERVVERHRRPVARPWARWLARVRFAR